MTDLLPTLSDEESAEIERLLNAGVEAQDSEVCAAIARHFLAEGYRRGVIACSSLCGRRAQMHGKHNYLTYDEAAACATAIRALLQSK